MRDHQLFERGDIERTKNRLNQKQKKNKKTDLCAVKTLDSSSCCCCCCGGGEIERCEREDFRLPNEFRLPKEYKDTIF